MGSTRFLLSAVVLLLLSVGLVQGGEEGGAGPGPATKERPAQKDGEPERLRQELKAVEQRLSAEREELARLRHKYVVAKGRVPTEKELKDFEENLAKKKATPLDNPYYNKNPLSTPGRARVAYYAKLEEVRRDEERVRRLKEELAGWDLKGSAR